MRAHPLGGKGLLLKWHGGNSLWMGHDFCWGLAGRLMAVVITQRRIQTTRSHKPGRNSRVFDPLATLHLCWQPKGILSVSEPKAAACSHVACCFYFLLPPLLSQSTSYLPLKAPIQTPDGFCSEHCLWESPSLLKCSEDWCFPDSVWVAKAFCAVCRTSPPTPPPHPSSTFSTWSVVYFLPHLPL